MERRSSERRRRTLDFLMAVKKEEGLIREASLEFSIWIAEDKIFEDDNVNPNVDKTIILLIDYYDIISYAAMLGTIDREMIIRHLGGARRSTYKVVEKYIDSRRKTLKRRLLYEPFVIQGRMR